MAIMRKDSIVSTTKGNRHRDQTLIEKSRNFEKIKQVLAEEYNENKLMNAIKRICTDGNVEYSKQILNQTMQDYPQFVTLRLFHVLFNVFTKNDCIHESEVYLDKMISIYGIMPDIKTATILITGCKRKGNKLFAEKVWKEMVIKYHLTPNLLAYDAMIGVYAKSGHQQLAEKLFKEMQEKHDIKPNIVVCTSLMKVYAENKDMIKVLKLKEYIESKQMKMTGITYLIIMTCYLKNHDYHSALNIYQEYLNVTKDNPPNIKMFNMQMVSYLGLVKTEINENKRMQYFDLIMNSITNELIQLNKKLAHTKLQAIIAFYENDFDKIEGIFKQLQQQNVFGYWSNDLLTIDLHYYGYDIVKFLIKYIFKHEKEFILNMDRIQFLCGRKRHSDPFNDSLTESSKGIAQFIATELLTYSPPIRSYNEKAFLVLNKNDVINYYKTKRL